MIRCFVLRTSGVLCSQGSGEHVLHVASSFLCKFSLPKLIIRTGSHPRRQTVAYVTNKYSPVPQGNYLTIYIFNFKRVYNLLVSACLSQAK